jgi:hypothetical protein
METDSTALSLWQVARSSLGCGVEAAVGLATVDVALVAADGGSLAQPASTKTARTAGRVRFIPAFWLLPPTLVVHFWATWLSAT